MQIVTREEQEGLQLHQADLTLNQNLLKRQRRTFAYNDAKGQPTEKTQGL